MIFDLVKNNNLKELRRNPDLINSRNEDGDTCLHIACAHGYKSIVKFLVKKKVDLDLRNKNGNTCLHIACYFRLNSIIVILIKAGANLEIVNDFGANCFSIACSHRFKSVLFVLIKFGANLNIQNKNGITGLHLTRYQEHVFNNDFLIKTNANVEIKDVFYGHKGVDPFPRRKPLILPAFILNEL